MLECLQLYSALPYFFIHVCTSSSRLSLWSRPHLCAPAIDLKSLLEYLLDIWDLHPKCHSWFALLQLVILCLSKWQLSHPIFLFFVPRSHLLFLCFSCCPHFRPLDSPVGFNSKAHPVLPPLQVTLIISYWTATDLFICLSNYIFMW